MKNKLKKYASFLLILTLVFCFVGCGSKKSNDSNSKSYDGTVKLGFTTWIGYAPLFVAKEKGLFKKNGAEVDIQIIESAGDIKAAAIAKRIDGFANTIDTVTMAAGAGLDCVQVLALDTSDGGDGIVANSKYKSLKDLKGKQVALDTTGGPSLFYFNYLIDQEGLTMDDFDVKNMSSGDAGSAFAGGSVDAAVTWEPWLSKAKESDFGTVLRSSDEDPGVIADTLCFNKEFIKKYPDTVQAIVDSWFDALDYIKKNPEESYKIMADSQGMTVDDFKEQLNCVTYYDKDKNNEYFGNKEINEIVKQASDLWVKLKFIDKNIDADSIIDESFVTK